MLFLLSNILILLTLELRYERSRSRDKFWDGADSRDNAYRSHDNSGSELNFNSSSNNHRSRGSGRGRADSDYNGADGKHDRSLDRRGEEEKKILPFIFLFF